eukprot:CAMPEP_0170183138 /NCGR_PEP_ID=MMETSP0040_2-20121228/29748_1 /TAXON_ID=641309 /ORGANISM="Lotharella oceanica, Strain CCMP622" /LENGTH=69 /DNA_ID=CAMNT_0010428777 /DNA_START=451 /DNA_END=660 /DNA_ORIENTATION=+
MPCTSCQAHPGDGLHEISEGIPVTDEVHLREQGPLPIASSPGIPRAGGPVEIQGDFSEILRRARDGEDG